jgi:hypothetical protein
VDCGHELAQYIAGYFESFFRERWNGGNADCFAYSDFYVYTDPYLHIKEITLKTFIVSGLLLMLIDTVAVSIRGALHTQLYIMHQDNSLEEIF